MCLYPSHRQNCLLSLPAKQHTKDITKIYREKRVNLVRILRTRAMEPGYNFVTTPLLSPPILGQVKVLQVSRRPKISLPDREEFISTLTGSHNEGKPLKMDSPTA